MPIDSDVSLQKSNLSLGVHCGFEGAFTDRFVALHADIGEELRRREIVRSSNNPTGDLAEYLFCQAFGWKRYGNSESSVDAEGQDGKRYQIKGRRLTRHSKSRQLSAIREMEGERFDFLAGLLFSEDYSILKAALIPHAVVLASARYVERTNSHRFLLRDTIWDLAGVVDVTAQLRAVAWVEG